MRTDVALPIMKGMESRDEILIVYFDGFIKNITEGVIRTMIRDEETWTEKYPDLETFCDMNEDELYDNTMIFFPEELMASIGKDDLTNEEILKDKKQILSDVILDNSKTTSFEFALYQLLHEDFVKKCYIYKEEDFEDYEAAYVDIQYQDVIGKIEMVSGGFLTLFESVSPTTVFTSDDELVTKYIPENYSNEILEDIVFVILNTTHNVTYAPATNEEEFGNLIQIEEFTHLLESLDEKHDMNITTMYNFALEVNSTEEEIDSIIYDDEEEEDDD